MTELSSKRTIKTTTKTQTNPIAKNNTPAAHQSIQAHQNQLTSSPASFFNLLRYASAAAAHLRPTHSPYPLHLQQHCQHPGSSSRQCLRVLAWSGQPRFPSRLWFALRPFLRRQQSCPMLLSRSREGHLVLSLCRRRSERCQVSW